MHALANSEELTTCFLNVNVPDGQGSTVRILELTLEGAYVNSSSLSASTGSPFYESLSIGYETLEWFNPVTGERFTETMGSSSVGPR